MGSGDSPAVARHRVRLALRSAREARDLTQGQVAEAMEWSLSKVMRIESGEVTISLTDLRAVLSFLGITDPSVVEGLLRDARDARKVRRHDLWWADVRYREHISPGLRKLIQFEAGATVIREFSTTLIPAPLQTPTYAATVLRGRDFAGAGVEIRLEVRLRRQRELLSRPDPPRLLALLDESVLYREMGGPEVMGQQLRELLRFAERGQVEARVIPLAAAAPIATLGSFVVLDLPGEENALLYHESHLLGDEAVEDRESISRHRDVFEQLWNMALDAPSSVALIERRAKAMLSTRHQRRQPAAVRTTASRSSG